VADRWRIGRVFVAGDAAHQQPPFLGQGMCQGVRDVANLSWKLAAVLRGEAGDALLDTYGIERKGHVIALTTRIRHIGEAIGERDLARARARDARLLAECGGVVTPTPRQEVQPALTAGLINADAHAANGTLFPQPWLRKDGAQQRMDAAAGTGWRLVLNAGVRLAVDAGLLPVPATVLHLDSPALTETDGVLAAWFARHRCAAALVRPDHYVYGVAGDPRQLEVMLNNLQHQIKRGD
jgi:3-(3-hydroxy-phenyl)propionate hydroxylase